MKKSSKIYVAGHKGMVGSAIVRVLKENGFNNLILRTRRELDLLNFNKVKEFFGEEKPDYVFLAAAKVGGIGANIASPVDFLLNNLKIQNNIIENSYLSGVKKFCFLGSSCIYPKECKQPIKEDYLLTGPLEPTNEGYALAKIAGMRLGQYYNKQYGFKVLNLMPCNLYGKNDHFDLKKSHVMSALIKRFTDAVDEGKTEITLWGTGKARRELMNVDDLAEAVLFFMLNHDSSEHINIGTGIDISIKDLANLIAKKTGFKGEIKWDVSKPDGMLRKCMDVLKMKSYGFEPKISIEKGVEQMIQQYKEFKKGN